jgi:FkbM family methyltransferase
MILSAVAGSNMRQKFRVRVVDQFSYAHATRSLSFTPRWTTETFQWLSPETLDIVPESEFLDALDSMAGAGRTAVDVGAHCGFYSVLLSRLFRKVLAFEPSDYQHSLLLQNLECNHCDNVEPVPKAVGREARDETLYVTGKSGGTNTLVPPDSDHPPLLTYSVAVEKLDAFNLRYLDFMKVDVEGYEAEVLLGGIETLERCRPTLLLESNLGSKSRARALQILDALGYGTGACVLRDRTDMLLFQSF